MRKHLGKMFGVVMFCTALMVLLSITVLASDSIEKQSKTYSPTTGEGGDIIVTTANKFATNQNYSNAARVYFEIDGLDFESNDYYYRMSTSYYGSTIECTTDNKAIITVWEYDLSVGQNTINFKIYNSDESIVYEGISFDVEIVESLPAVESDDAVYYEQLVVPEGEEIINFGFFAQPGLENCIVKTIDETDNTYALTTRELSSYTTARQDPRYKNIFCNAISEQILLRDSTHYNAYMYGLSDITAGNYSIIIKNGEEEIYRFTDAVTVTDLPVVSVSYKVDDYYVSCPPPQKDDTEFYVDMTLSNGDFEYYSIILRDDENSIVAESTGEYLIYHVYNQEKQAAIKMRMKDGYSLVDTYNYYSMEVISQKEFITKSISDFYVEDKALLGVDVPYQQKANFVIKSVGYSPDRQYKLNLEQNWETIATAYAFPTANGIFDVEFCDGEGNVLSLENYTSYNVKIIEKSSYTNDWEEWGNSVNYWVSYAETTPSGGNVSYPNITGNVYINGSEINGQVWVKTELADNYSNDLFSFQATRIDGTVYSINSLNVTTSTVNNGQRVYIYLLKDISDMLPHSRYYLKLLYNGDEVASYNYETVYNSYPDISWGIGQYNGLRAVSDFYIYNIEGDSDAVLELYNTDEFKTSPDYTIPLQKSGDGYVIPNTVEYDKFQNYYSVMYINGNVVNCLFNDAYYYMPESYTLGDEEFTVTVLNTDNGILSASVENAKIGDTVYIYNTPDEGYEFVPNSLKANGKSVNGRAFVVTGDMTVSAEFREIMKSKNSVEIDEDIYNGTVSTDKEMYAESETVKVNIVPEKGYALSQLRYRDINWNHEYIDIDLESCSFVMPDYDIEISAQFSYKDTYYAGTNTTNGCSVLFDGEEGWHYLPEGEEISVMVISSSGAEIPLEHIDKLFYKTGYYDETEYPIENGKFIMPSTSIEVYCEPKIYHLNRSFTGEGYIRLRTEADPYGVSEACYGETVYVYVYDTGSFTYVPGTLKVDGMLLEDNSFIMPGKDVTVSAEFTSETYHRIFLPELENGYINFYSNYDYGADVGDTVEVYVQANDNYRLENICYNGEDMTNEEGNWYTFIMPNSDVTVTVDIVPDTYTVTFKNYDGSVLGTTKVYKGESAEYTGGTPQKPSDSGYMYEFVGWDTSLSEITENATAVAQYIATTYKAIYTEVDLLTIKDDLSGHYVLMNDITLTKPWNPIGGTQIGGNGAFEGVFDGNKHIIRNVVIPAVYDMDYEYEVSGFFNSLYGATVKNLGLEIQFGGKNDFHGSELRVGGLAGQVYESIIENCYVQGSIYTAANYYASVGGLVGSAVDGTQVKNCYSDVGMTVKGSYPEVGGLVSYSQDSIIENCYSNSSINILDAENMAAGGILAYDTNWGNHSSTIVNSYYNSDRYKYTQNGYGTPKTSEELKDIYTYFKWDADNDTYSGWDFDNVWSLDSKINDGYPNLRFNTTELELAVTEVVHNSNVNLLEIEISFSKYTFGALIFAGYKNGRLVSLDTTYDENYHDLLFNGGRFKFYYTDEFDTLKVMLWKNMRSMTPLSNSIIIPKNEWKIWSE